MKTNQSQHVLMIGNVWPEPDSSAAGRRIIQLISLFHLNDWKVTFASNATESKFQADLHNLNIETVHIDVNNDRFDTWIHSLQPSIVLYDRFMTEEKFGWRVFEQCPKALGILDTEDLHCLRRVREQACKNGISFNEESLLNEEITKREIAAIYRSDLSLIISEYEMNLLRELFDVRSNLLSYVPFLVNEIDEKTTREWPPFESRSNFITVGNFLHEPNWNAIQYLKKDLWPLIRKKLPEAELHIYGSYASQKAHNLHRPEEGFYIKGRAENAKAVVKNARVCLAPLRFGAGLKGKLIEAMQCGTPSITTDIGAEGINGELEWSGVIANRPDEFATAAVELYNNETKWKESQKNGVRIINHRFRKDLFAPGLIDRITGLQQSLEEHRLQNFTGSMLRHHTMAGTKYMSKWIEAKNRSNTGNK